MDESQFQRIMDRNFLVALTLGFLLSTAIF